MMTFMCLLVTCLVISLLCASSEKLVWTQQIPASGGQAGISAGYGITIDQAGNVYVVGEVFGSIYEQPYSGQGADIALLKYSPDGELMWARLSGGSSGSSSGYAIAFDSNSNEISITGTTSDILNGQKPIGTSDLFVMRVSSSGETLWTSLCGQNIINEIIYPYTIGYGVVHGSDGSVYSTGTVSGYFPGQKNYGYTDLALVKFDAKGSLKFAVQAGSWVGDSGRAVAVDAQDFVYVLGYAGGPIDGQPWPTTELTYNMICLQKYDQYGSRLWTRLSGAANDILTMENNFGNALLVQQVGNSGNPVLTGSVTASSSTGRRSDSILRMYDPAGNELWAQQSSCGDACSLSPNGLALVNGTAAVIAGTATGSYSGQPFVGGSSDYFLAQFASNGDGGSQQTAPTWVAEGGGDQADRANAVTACPVSGNVFVTGSITTRTKPYTIADVFVAKYTASTD